MEKKEGKLFSPLAEPWKPRDSANNPWQRRSDSRKSLIDYRQPCRKSPPVCHGLPSICHVSGLFATGRFSARFAPLYLSLL